MAGYSGGEVNIRCKYNIQYTANAKYFCRGKKPEKVKHGWCSELIRTKETDKWVDETCMSLNCTLVRPRIPFTQISDGHSENCFSCVVIQRKSSRINPFVRLFSPDEFRTPPMLYLLWLLSSTKILCICCILYIIFASQMHLTSQNLL